MRNRTKKHRTHSEVYIRGGGPVDQNGVHKNLTPVPEITKDGPLLQQFLQIVKLLSENEHVDGVKPDAK